MVNVDACRLSASGNKTFASRFAGDSREKYRTGTASSQVPSSLGRWPANVCLDEAAAAALDEQSGTERGFMPRERRARRARCATAPCRRRCEAIDHRGQGRRLSILLRAKASRSEREAGWMSSERLSLGARFSSDDGPDRRNGGRLRITTPP